MQSETSVRDLPLQANQNNRKKEKPNCCPLEATFQKGDMSEKLDKLDIQLTKEAQEEAGSLSPREDSRRKLEEILRITGTFNVDMSTFIISHTVEALDEKDTSRKYNIILQGLHELNPSDAIESMLCSQILALYSQGMDNLRKANTTTSVSHRESYTRWAIKLLRLQQETIEKLEKYRRKGQQTVQVEHVHVHQGAQAIVGNITTGVGCASKNAQ